MFTTLFHVFYLEIIFFGAREVINSGQSVSCYLALVQGVRPFSVKISVLVCVVSHSILLSTKTARYSVIIWPSLWFTGPPSEGVRPFSVKISVLVRVVSHSILLSTETARYSVIIWPSLWFTGPPSDLLLAKAELTTDHRAYRKHWQEISELFMPEGLCIRPWADMNLKLFASIDPHHDAVILKLYWGFKSLM